MSYYTKYLKYKKKYRNLQKGGMIASIVSSTKGIYNWFSTPSKFKNFEYKPTDISTNNTIQNKNGTGILIFTNDPILKYDGTFKDNQFKKGQVFYRSGNDIIEINGAFNNLSGIKEEDPKKELLEGTITFANGDIHSGNFVNSNLTNGTITLAKGPISTYKGRFSNNQLLEGIVSYNAGKIREIEGTFNDGSQDPIIRLIKGTVKFKDGDIHTGDFINGNLTNGTMTDFDGNIYSGNFINGILNQKTKYTVIIKNDFTFEGIDDKDWRMGKYTDDNEIKEGYFTKDTYDIIRGKITFIESGIIYKTKEGGIFIKDKLNGPGKIHNNEDKTIQEGNFQDGDLKDGILTYEGKGKIKCENFNHYKPTGLCTIKFADGTVYTNNFTDGYIKGVNTDPIKEQKEYNLILYIISHGCDVKDDLLGTFNPLPDKIISSNIKKYINMRYASAVDYNQCSISYHLIDLYYIIALLNSGGKLDEQINKYQKWKGRINPKLSTPNYNHEYSFDDDDILNPKYGIYIIDNDLGLPNYVNIFNFTKPDYINDNVKELSEIMAKKINKNSLSLRKFQRGIYDWFEIVRKGGEKKLNLTLIDVSCRNYCNVDEVKSSLP